MQRAAQIASLVGAGEQNEGGQQDAGVLLDRALERGAAPLVEAAEVRDGLRVHAERRRAREIQADVALPSEDVLVLSVARDGEVLAPRAFVHDPLALSG